MNHRRGHVLRIEYPALAGLSILLERLLIPAHLDEVRRHVARLDRRNLQSRAGGLQSQALGQRLHEELARRVDRKTGKDFPSSVRRDHDDVSPPSLQHPRQHRAYAVERALAVDLDGKLPLLLAPVLHQGVVHDSSAVDEDLHGTKLLLGTRHERPHLPTFRNICRHYHALLAVTAFEPSLDLLKRLFPAGRQRHARPFRVQRLRYSGADTARRSGHHSNPVLKRSHLHAETTLSQRYSQESFLL